jgi:prepilin-type N-terminal cleavage/methylation domain-containing protein
MKNPAPESRLSLRQGFTLIEVLVSSALVAVVMSMLFSVLVGVMNAWDGGTSRLQTNGDARMALDMIARDLQSLVARQTTSDQEWLVSYARAVDSADAPGLSSTWLTFFAPSIDRDPGQMGDIVAISYSTAFQDPLAVGTNEYFRIFGLYKTMATTQDTFTDALGQTDIIAGFWNNRLPAGQPPKEDLLIPNVVRFDVAWWIRYEVSPGTEVLRRFGSDSTIRLSNVLIVDGNPLNGTIESAEISLTLLDAEGMGQAQAFSEAGTLTEEKLEEIIRLYGRVQTTKVAINY